MQLKLLEFKYHVQVRVSIAAIKYYGQKQLGEERIYLIYISISLFNIGGSQDRNAHRAGSWRQELMQRPWRGAVYWLVPRGLLSLLSYRTQDQQPRDGTTCDVLGTPPSITN